MSYRYNFLSLADFTGESNTLHIYWLLILLRLTGNVLALDFLFGLFEDDVLLGILIKLLNFEQKLNKELEYLSNIK